MIRDNSVYYQHSYNSTTAYHKHGFVKKNRFYPYVNEAMISQGYSVKELQEIIEYMKNNHPESEHI